MGYKLPELLKREPRKSEEGVTFTSNPAAALWSVEVHFENGMPVSKETIRALDEQQAKSLILNRYPYADAEKTKVTGRSSQLPLPSLPPTPRWDLGRMVLDQVRVAPRREKPAPSPLKDEALEWEESEPTTPLDELDLLMERPEDAPPLVVLNEDPSELRKRLAAASGLSLEIQQGSTYEDNDPLPEAKVEAPEPEPLPVKVSIEELPVVTPGELDSHGRRVLSKQNARAAAVLHHAGRMTWTQLSVAIGVNQDHLRKTARRFYPDFPAVPAQRSGRISATAPSGELCVPISDLTPGDAQQPVLAWAAGGGWRPHQFGNQSILERAGCRWVIRLSDLPKPPQICGSK